MDPLPDHFHEVLDTRSFRGLGRLALIGPLLVTRRCGFATPPTTPSASGIDRAWLQGMSVGFFRV